MACCVLVAAVLAQIFETLRRLRAFFRPADARNTPGGVQQRRWFKQAVLVGLSVEMLAVGGWVIVEHREHLEAALLRAGSWIGVITGRDAAVCRGERASGRGGELSKL